MSRPCRKRSSTQPLPSCGPTSRACRCSIRSAANLGFWPTAASTRQLPPFGGGSGQNREALVARHWRPANDQLCRTSNYVDSWRARMPSITFGSRDPLPAVDTTNLPYRPSSLVGMISTHWHTPHQPSERDVRHLDRLARRATDLVVPAPVDAERSFRSMPSSRYDRNGAAVPGTRAGLWRGMTGIVG
jgi:hypothetical protein